MDSELMHKANPSTEEEPFRPALDRDAETIVEHRVNNRTEALALYQQLQQYNNVAWVECTDFQDIQQLAGSLAAIPHGVSACLFLNIPSDYPHLYLVEAELSGMLDDVLFSLWPQGLKLHLIRLGTVKR